MKWTLPVYKQISTSKMKFWGHSSYLDPKKILQKAFFSYTAQKNMLISILGNRKQKPADWWCEIIKDGQGERTAHQHSVRKCPDGLVPFSQSLDQRKPCGVATSGFWDQCPSEEFFTGSLFKSGRRRKNKSTEGQCTEKQEHKGASRRTDFTARWENQGKEAPPLPPPSPEGPGKNKPKAALSIPSVAGPNLSVSLWDYKHGHSSHAWPLRDALPSLQGQNPFERNPILKIFEN